MVVVVMVMVVVVVGGVVVLVGGIAALGGADRGGGVCVFPIAALVISMLAPW